MKNTILSLIRHGLTFGGGVLVAQGKLSEPTVESLVAAIAALVGVIWGAFDEYKAEQAANKGPLSAD